MKFSRRRFLLGASGAAFALPSLEAFGQAVVVPPRLVLFFSANGTLYERWEPTDAAHATSSPLLSPLASVEKELLPIGNLDMTSARTGLGDDHGRGIAHLWTGTAMVGSPSGPEPWWAGGPSVDQVAAQTLGQETALRSLELGVQVQTAKVWDRMIARGPGQPVPPEVDPFRLYDRLFASATATPREVQRRRERRQSVLDFVGQELKRVRGQVGRADALRLDAHAEAVREVEYRLEAQARATACVAGPRPGELVLEDPSQFEAIGRLHQDLLVLALTCDVTRVASLQYSSSTSAVVFRWLGCTVEHHELSHRADSDASAAAQLELIGKWYAGEYGRLIGKLAAVTTPDGKRLLDHTVLAWGNELGRGNIHSHTKVPFVVAGGSARGLQPGRFIDARGAAHNLLLTSLLEAVGVSVPSFGDPQYGVGPLPGLTG